MSATLPDVDATSILNDGLAQVNPRYVLKSRSSPAHRGEDPLLSDRPASQRLVEAADTSRSRRVHERAVHMQVQPAGLSANGTLRPGDRQASRWRSVANSPSLPARRVRERATGSRASKPATDHPTPGSEAREACRIAEVWFGERGSPPPRCSTLRGERQDFPRFSSVVEARTCAPSRPR